jgi:hypothetical protein
MTMAEELPKNQDEVEIDVKNQKLRIRGSDVLGILQLVLISLLAYGGWKHDVDAADNNKAVQAVKEQTQVQRDSLNAQREANCLNRLTAEQRKQPKELEFCRELGKGR